MKVPIHDCGINEKGDVWVMPKEWNPQKKKWGPPVRMKMKLALSPERLRRQFSQSELSSPHAIIKRLWREGVGADLVGLKITDVRQKEIESRGLRKMGRVTWKGEIGKPNGSLGEIDRKLTEAFRVVTFIPESGSKDEVGKARRVVQTFYLKKDSDDKVSLIFELDARFMSLPKTSEMDDSPSLEERERRLGALRAAIETARVGDLTMLEPEDRKKDGWK